MDRTYYDGGMLLTNTQGLHVFPLYRPKMKFPTHRKLLSWLKCKKIIVPFPHISKQSLFFWGKTFKNVTASQTITAAGEFSNILDDLTEMVSLFEHKCCVSEQKPFIRTSPKIYVEMNQSVVKHKNMGQDLNELQASSIWCTCDKSHSCISGAAFQKKKRQ